MKIRTILFGICILFVFLIPRSSQPCTTFCLDEGNQPVVGKNFDWMVGDALVIINKRTVSKTAFLNPEWDEEQPAIWVSKYGSVTFNPWGREFPFSGINESGLVVSAMGLGESEYPAPDSRPSITACQWIQYQLDNFSTVEEVITGDSQLRISPSDPMPYHFLICDSRENCATLEFIGGKLVYHTRETMPVKVLTNITYAKCIEYWEKNEMPTPDYAVSVKRFIIAADMLTNYDPETSGSAIDYAFNILSNVTWFIPTQWYIVYDIQNLRVYFHTLDNEQIRYVDLSSFDFSCKTPVKVLDIKENLSGDVSGNFVDYTYEINRKYSLLIDNAYFGYDLPDELLDAFAHYPETTVCTEIDCFIATAAYGSPLEPQVNILREFRDRFLLDNTLGKTFVSLYNTYSPPLADFIARHDNLRAMVRLGLLPIVGVSLITLKIGPVPTMLLMILLVVSISIAAADGWRKNKSRKVNYEC